MYYGDLLFDYTYIFTVDAGKVSTWTVCSLLINSTFDNYMIDKFWLAVSVRLCSLRRWFQRKIK